LRKACLEDFNYFKKEIAFKVDKNDIDQFKTEFIERIQLNENKVHEKIQSIKGLKETAEATEANFRHFKALVEARVDGKADITEVQCLKTELKQ